ncbi:MAG: hypothetical protein V3T49_04000 [Dehalococcoidia bacterium]
MAKRSRTSSPISNFESFPTDNASVESTWREALAFRDLGADQPAKSRKRLAQAQAVRVQAESEAITATKNYCVDARAEADHNLMQANLTLTEAERIRSDAQKWASSIEEEIQFRLDDASRKRSGAQAYAEKLEATTRDAADALMDQTRSGAEEMASRMRRESAEDIRKILTDIEVARAAAEDELEAQRLLTETARVRAFTIGLNAQNAEAELAKTNSSAPKAKKRTAKANTKATAKLVKPTPISTAKPRTARKSARKAA